MARGTHLGKKLRKRGVRDDVQEARDRPPARRSIRGIRTAADLMHGTYTVVALCPGLASAWGLVAGHSDRPVR